MQSDFGARVFCTYFDSNYLDRGLCLWRSLKKSMRGARLHVCCLDSKVFEFLNQVADPNLVPVRLETLEKEYAQLVAAKATRSRVEYYFTITPSWVRYVLEKHDVEAVTYLDSDLLFFSDPTPLFQEMDCKRGDVAIIGHRFASRLEHLKIHGLYNVGWITFKNTKRAYECLLDWQTKCCKWCYDRIEGEKFADQKYLDAWQTEHAGVVVLEHPGANVALWNLDNRDVSGFTSRIKVKGQGLIFYHFHGLSQLSDRLFFTSARIYNIELDPIVQLRVYGRYMSMLRSTQKTLKQAEIFPLLRLKYNIDDVEFQKDRPYSGNFLSALPPPLRGFSVGRKITAHLESQLS